MNDEFAIAHVREALARLDELRSATYASQDRLRWIGELNEGLEQLENALADEADLSSEFFRETVRRHPRLITSCASFFEEGRKLLLQATVLVRLSARGCGDSAESIAQLQAATDSLVGAVQRHLRLAADITLEAGHDIGGQG